MALTKCEECGGQLSDRAMSCPHCGAPARKVGRRVAAVMVGLLAAMAGGLVMLSRAREGVGAADERALAPMVVAGLIAALAAVMGLVALVRGTRR